MLRRLVCGQALRRLRTFEMQPVQAVAWQQSGKFSGSVANVVPRGLSAHAQVFVPRSKAAVQSCFGTTALYPAAENYSTCCTSAVAARRATLPTSLGCSTTLTDTVYAATTNQRPRNVRTYAVAAKKEEATLQAGCIVAFKTDTRQDLALLQRPNGKQNWFATDAYEEADLQQIQTAALSDADAALLADAWEMVHEEEELYSVQTMAELLFGNTEATSCYASHYLLNQERIFFKQASRSPPLFQARSPKDVNALRMQRDAEEQAEAAKQAFGQEIYRARKLAHDDKPNAEQWQSGQYGARLEAVQAFALDLAPPSQLSLALESLQACGQASSSSAAAELLQACGWWRPHEQVSLIRAERTETFPDAAQDQASSLISNPPAEADAERRKDFTHMEVMTIDDASTRDVDDGLSVEVLPSGQHRLWVHIADPTRWVTPGDPLDIEARRRARTMYLPTGNIPMFPRDLADGLFSLHVGKATPAMSIHMTLTPEGDLEDFGIDLSTIQVSKKLTYKEVDELLDQTMPEQEPEIWALHKAAELRHRYRQDQGALNFQLPEAKIQVQQPYSTDASVQVEPTAPLQTEAQASQLLVSEMMILAGQAIALLGQQHSIALPYRGQNEPVLPTEEELEAVPYGPCRDVMLRSRMVRSISSTDKPTPHAGLGLPGYVQFTSPIRRYGDMLAHWQLKAFLRGQPTPFTAYQLSQLMEITNSMIQETVGLERDVTNYWLALYFQAQKDLGRTYSALMLMWLRTESGLARVLLEDIGLETVMKINRPAQAGEKLTVSVNYVDVVKGIFKFEEISTGTSDLAHEDDELSDESEASDVSVGATYS